MVPSRNERIAVLVAIAVAVSVKALLSVATTAGDLCGSNNSNTTTY